MNNKNQKIVLYIVLTLVMVILLIGGTYAYWVWHTTASEKTLVTFTVESNFSCAVDGGGNISNQNVKLAPTAYCNGERAIKRTIQVMPTTSVPIYLDLWLDVNSIGSGFTESKNLRYVLTTSADSCTTDIITSGTFTDNEAGSKIHLLSDKTYTNTTTDTYYLYIWLDAAETSMSMMNQNFSLSLNGSCTNNVIYQEPILNGAAPELNNGLIPVVIDNSGSETTITTIRANDSNWYSYEDKKWANAILVSSSSRANYQGTTGVSVDESDILAYYVWVPRYKYKIWNTSNNSATGNEQTIEIIFESNITPKSTGSTIGEYITHPGFSFGGEELNGIWVGKFETTGTASQPTILPNVSSLRSQNASSQFITSLIFSGGTLSNGNVSFAGSTYYGLSRTTDSHMMKNDEWGAVAYLSHSIFGINQEIYINNSSSFYTGRSGGAVGGSTNTVQSQYPSSGSTDTKQYYSYGYYTWDGKIVNYGGSIDSYASDRNLGTKASTTGNITGIYDMSGGSWEYVMGNYQNYSGYTARSYTASEAASVLGRTDGQAVGVWNSGFNGPVYGKDYNSETGLWDIPMSITNGIDFPPNKYYNLYTGTNPLTACDGGICFGIGFSETKNWYRDYAYFVSLTNPWFVRGGGCSYGPYAGAFYSDFDFGNARSSYSFRTVLVTG